MIMLPREQSEQEVSIYQTTAAKSSHKEDPFINTRNKLRQSGAAKRLEFIPYMVSGKFVELIHVSTGSYIRAEITSQQSLDPSFLKELLPEMKEKLKSTMLERFKYSLT